MSEFASNPALRVTGLDFLMGRSAGVAGIRVALVDGPCDTGNKVLSATSVRVLGNAAASCGPQPGPACTHATYVASILFGSRDSEIPGICPRCAFLLRPIYCDQPATAPKASMQDLAD